MPDSIFLREKWDEYNTGELKKRHSSPFPFALAFDLSRYERLYYSMIGLQQQQRLKIWFPGCGLSIGPALFTAFGHNVWASDISPVAITYQTVRLPASKVLAECRELFTTGKGSLGPSLLTFLDRTIRRAEDQEGVLHFVEHDFCMPCFEEDFDCIVNVRSFQILPEEMLYQAAQRYWEALRPGGIAYFQTMNVADSAWRQAIEGSLAKAGFAVTHHVTKNTFAQDKQIKVAEVSYSMG